MLLQDGSWAYRFRATSTSTEAAPKHSSVGVAEVEVLLTGSGDPGYHFTAAGLAETALCLAGRVPGCGNGGGSGVVTTMAALNPHTVLRRLQSVGLVDVNVTVTRKRQVKSRAGSDPEELHRVSTAYADFVRAVAVQRQKP